MRPVRNSAKAVIIEDGQLLSIKKGDELGEYYILPGGGQDPGESLVDAVRRECREELGTDVTVGELLWIREYIGRNHEFAEQDADFHQVEFMFACRVDFPDGLGSGHLLDDGQTGIEWLPLAALEHVRLYPAALRPLLSSQKDAHGPLYLGDVN